MTRPVERRSVERELARARGSRKLLPWAVLSALGGAAIGLAGGGGVRAAASLFAVGLVFALFVWMTAVPRCPSCGARLPARGEPPAACPGCRARFE